jgi:FkbM family methyltransferase
MEQAMISKLIDNKAFREILKLFKVHLVLECVFKTFPQKKQSGKFSYTVASLEAWLVEKEIFKKCIYDGVFDLADIRTFADLGCNRGFFAVWLANKARSDLKGILVEANPFLISEIQTLLKMNQFSTMHVFYGAAGAGMVDGEVEILIPPTDVGAGLSDVTFESLKGDSCKRVCVPILTIGKIWNEKFSSGERCDLLKVDIEGAELRFFEDEGDFLALVDRLVVEVHESMISLEEVKKTLTSNGFSLVKECKEDSETSLIFAERRIQAAKE